MSDSRKRAIEATGSQWLSDIKRATAEAGVPTDEPPEQLLIFAICSMFNKTRAELHYIDSCYLAQLFAEAIQPRWDEAREYLAKKQEETARGQKLARELAANAANN